MQTNRNQNGLTLVELLIATVMMGIVMLGVVAIDYTIRRTQKVSSESSEVEARATAAMVHILRNGLLATGYKGNEGIRPVNIDTSALGENDSICIRQDGGSPEIFTDDVWIRYHCDTGTRKIIYCSDVGNIDVFAGDCPDTAARACAGTEFDLMAEFSVCKFYFWADDSVTTPKLYLEVDLESIKDQSAAQDSMINPSFRATSQVSPIGHTY